MSCQYQVNVDEEGRPFPHYWELCVGSCHAATLLRADVQEQIRRAHEEIGFQYPTNRQLAELEAESCPIWSTVPTNVDDTGATTRFTALPESVTVFEVVKQ